MQDTWKATPRLTVDAGVRWEPIQFLKPIGMAPVGIYSEERYKAGIRSTVFEERAVRLFCMPATPTSR